MLAALACHGSFVVAIAVMVVELWSGMTHGLGRLTGPAAWLANGALLLQFPLLHSGLLGRRGRRVLARIVPGRFGAQLAPTTFALVASLQLLTTFVLWSPTGTVLWEPTGALATMWWLPVAGSWLFLIKAVHDGGLGLQTGFIGWIAVWRGTRPAYGPLRQHGLFAVCRQPIYLGFALTLWSGPVWTPDHLVTALVWTTYCAFGPLLKERRYAAIHGAEFASYRSRVPYMIPRFAR